MPDTNAAYIYSDGLILFLLLLGVLCLYTKDGYLNVFYTKGIFFSALLFLFLFFLCGIVCALAGGNGVRTILRYHLDRCDAPVFWFFTCVVRGGYVRVCAL